MMSIVNAVTAYYLFIILNVRLSSSAYIFGLMLHNPVLEPQEAAANAPPGLMTSSAIFADESRNSAQQVNSVRCKSSADCSETQYCDKHYGVCDRLRKADEFCRQDEQCTHDLICMYGQCVQPSLPGHDGSRCDSDDDCQRDHCCARRHGHKVCKPRLSRGQKCFVPSGGLEYSINETCPCAEGLICSTSQRKRNHNNNKKMDERRRPSVSSMKCTPV